MSEIKEIGYDEIRSSYNDKAICPYCGYENYVEGEDYGNQDEEQPDVCGSCQRHFVRVMQISITFNSEPVENFYLHEKERIEKQIKSYEKDKDPKLLELNEMLIKQSQRRLKTHEDFYRKNCEENIEIGYDDIIGGDE